LPRALHLRSVSIPLTLILLFGFASQAWAHAILVKSKPALHSSVNGPDVAIWLRFNVRIDGGRSRVQLAASDGSLQTLSCKQSSPDILESQASGLKPGAYKLIWNVLASDGHMSKGEVPFTVN